MGELRFFNKKKPEFTPVRDECPGGVGWFETLSLCADFNKSPLGDVLRRESQFVEKSTANAR